MGHARKKSSTSKPQDISDIVEWLQCSGTYIAIVSRTEPHPVSDLLGYQNLIIQAYCKYQKGCWQTYERDFCRKVSASYVAEWSTVDTTLWNLAFSGCSNIQSTAPMLPTGTIFTNNHSLPHLKAFGSVWNGTNTVHQAVLILPVGMTTSATGVSITQPFQTKDIKQSFVLTKTRRGSDSITFAYT